MGRMSTASRCSGITGSIVRSCFLERGFDGPFGQRVLRVDARRDDDGRDGHTDDVDRGVALAESFQWAMRGLAAALGLVHQLVGVAVVAGAVRYVFVVITHDVPDSFGRCGLMVTYAMYQVQHWGDVGGPFAHRTTGKHVVAAHADDQNIMMVIDVADYAVTHPSRGRADLPTVRHATVQPARRATREASMIDEQIFIRDADGVEPPAEATSRCGSTDGHTALRGEERDDQRHGTRTHDGTSRAHTGSIATDASQNVR